jgi:hypothetical protein
MSDLSHLDAVANLRRRRLEREALGTRDDTPLGELFVRGLYAAGICMILASLFL